MIVLVWTTTIFLTLIVKVLSIFFFLLFQILFLLSLFFCMHIICSCFNFLSNYQSTIINKAFGLNLLFYSSYSFSLIYCFGLLSVFLIAISTIFRVLVRFLFDVGFIIFSVEWLVIFQMNLIVEVGEVSHGILLHLVFTPRMLRAHQLNSLVLRRVWSKSPCLYRNIGNMWEVRSSFCFCSFLLKNYFLWFLRNCAK